MRRFFAKPTRMGGTASRSADTSYYSIFWGEEEDWKPFGSSCRRETLRPVFNTRLSSSAISSFVHELNSGMNFLHLDSFGQGTIGENRKPLGVAGRNVFSIACASKAPKQRDLFRLDSDVSTLSRLFVGGAGRAGSTVSIFAEQQGSPLPAKFLRSVFRFVVLTKPVDKLSDSLRDRLAVISGLVQKLNSMDSLPLSLIPDGFFKGEISRLAEYESLNSWLKY